MKEDISSALTYALSRGFQIHPDAFKILEKIDAKEGFQLFATKLSDVYAAFTSSSVWQLLSLYQFQERISKQELIVFDC